jgi:hypothetical protein
MKRKWAGNDTEENENRKQKTISRKVDDPWYLNLSKKQTLATQKEFVCDVRVGGGGSLYAFLLQILHYK